MSIMDDPTSASDANQGPDGIQDPGTNLSLVPAGLPIGVGEGSAPANEKNIYESNGWFGILADVTNILAPTRQDKQGTPEQQKRGEDPRDSWTVKVAVIDSGLIPDQHSRVFFKDFVSPKDEKGHGGDAAKEMKEIERDAKETGGHGTTIVALIRKVLPDVINDVEIYVARAFEKTRYDDKPTDIEVERIVNAIDWVKSQNVDIIVMAWGFSQEEERIREAINGIPRSTIVFVAAGNDSRHESVQFPARMELDDPQSPVTPIFATTSYNKNARKLNPPRMKDRPNFAILGDDVKIELTLKNHNQSGTDKVVTKTISGTSYSAAIAAGLAAYLIHFSRQPICRQPGRELDLEGKENMSAVFAEMSLGYADQGYLCISPGHLLRICKDRCRKDAIEWDSLRPKERKKEMMRDVLRGIVDDPRTILGKDFYFACTIS
ncbi:peptidase S8/S53 domain-containing protein [Cladorrhinum sp. PSN332]|nr:peptidase S8/S53 domain-containing protein [Cladorrhinum sp. PSN332]